MNKNSNHIYKYALEDSFFKLINSENDIYPVVKDGKPAIYWRENETTQLWWTYDDEEQRDHDIWVIRTYKRRLTCACQTK